MKPADSSYTWIQSRSSTGTFCKRRSAVFRKVSIGAVVACLALAGFALAADKDVKGKVVKIDAAKKILTVATDDGNKNYDLTDTTKVFTAKGAENDDGLKDANLKAGAMVKLVVAGNNKTVREIHFASAVASKPLKPAAIARGTS